MIYLAKVLNYLKYLGIFIIIMLIISFLISLLNLTGLSFKKAGVILIAISFFVISLKASLKTQEKGYLLGLKLSLMFVIFLILLNLIFFKSSFNIARIIYYVILIASSVLGGAIGKNIGLKKK